MSLSSIHLTTNTHLLWSLYIWFYLLLSGNISFFQPKICKNVEDKLNIFYNVCWYLFFSILKLWIYLFINKEMLCWNDYWFDISCFFSSFILIFSFINSSTCYLCRKFLLGSKFYFCGSFLRCPPVVSKFWNKKKSWSCTLSARELFSGSKRQTSNFTVFSIKKPRS